MMRRLGGRNWQRLHYLIYLIATLGVVHYWWLVKKDVTQPMLFAFGTAVLLGFRVLHQWRERSSRVRLPARDRR
jgi:sulfoxide reductase heme-binding subunit YedZ